MVRLPGHKVTALVRNEQSIASITTTGDNLTIVRGQPQDRADINKAFDAVPGDIPTVAIVTLNNARESDSPFAKPISPPTFMHDSHVNLIEAMKQYGTRKIVTLQALGVGDSWPNLFWLVKLLVHFTNLGIGYKDHEQAEEVIKQSGLTYVLARPARFIDETSGQVHFYGDVGQGIGAFKTVSRQSVATFLLDAAEKDDWNGKTPVISN
jgi:hypothetical protein